MTKLVSIAPYSKSSYTSLIYAGLYELQAEGAIKLRIDGSLAALGANGLPHFSTVIIRVDDTDSNQSERLVFDFRDGAELASPELLSEASIYYKRSYRSGTVEKLPPDSRQKVQPFGLHYACTSPRQTLLDRWRFVREQACLQTNGSRKVRSLGRTAANLKATASLGMAKYWKRNCPSKLPPLITELQSAPCVAAQPSIFYRTRVYSPSERNSTRGAAENENRVAVLRALKKEFGDRFVGGLRWSEYAEKNYPDCIFPHDINWRQHIGLLKKHLIAVTTAGLFDSIDWKLAEYLAASRCTVTERLRFELPKPLVDGQEILSFDTPEECVVACDRILTNNSLAETLREGAHNYYQDYLAPKQLMSGMLGLHPAA